MYFEIPAVDAPLELVDLCRDWHSGQNSAMYSVLSTGMIHPGYWWNLDNELREVANSAEDPDDKYFASRLRDAVRDLYPNLVVEVYDQEGILIESFYFGGDFDDEDGILEGIADVATLPDEWFVHRCGKNAVAFYNHDDESLVCTAQMREV